MKNSIFQYRKGQLSLEFLLIFAIFLSALFILVSSFSKVRTQTETSLNKILLDKIGNDIVYAVNTVCMMGEGNIRKIDSISIHNISLNCDGKTLNISLNQQSRVYTVNCNLICPDILNQKSIKIEKKEDKISIS